MKKIILFLGFITAIVFNTEAQSNNDAEAVIVAHRIAKKIKDSLDLTANQRQQLYDINMQLHDQKQGMRQQYTGNDSLLTVKIALVEKQRDSLYRPILGEEKYILYIDKKRNLISNN